MTKLYYDDPLKAVWMMREHGLMLEGLTIQNVLSFAYAGLHAEMIVSPDSYSIFEPVEGDKNIGGLVYDGKHWLEHGNIYRGSYDIDKRNNTAFFMPEEEL